jgi:quinol monooxygenase YgiN
VTPGPLEGIADVEQIRLVTGQHHHLDAYRYFRYRKVGRQIDGNPVWAAINALVGKPGIGQRPLRSSSPAALRPWAGVHHKEGSCMLTITAVIRVKKGHEETMRRALLEVAENVRVNEPGTVGFFISQEQENPSVFTTYERFVDEAAMDAHNNSQVVARFFGIAKPILDGDVILVTSTEISAKA